MSYGNCTSNMMIINIDIVYDMSFILWKCEVHIWTDRCLAGLYDIKGVFIIVQNTSSPQFTAFPSFPNKTSAEVAQLAGGKGQLLVTHSAQI